MLAPCFSRLNKDARVAKKLGGFLPSPLSTVCFTIYSDLNSPVYISVSTEDGQVDVQSLLSNLSFYNLTINLNQLLFSYLFISRLHTKT